MTERNSAFAGFLRQARSAAGLTQVDLARAAHVNQTTVSKWESGKALPSLSCAARVAEALELPLDALVEAAL